jgi:hypothetical protein
MSQQIKILDCHDCSCFNDSSSECILRFVLKPPASFEDLDLVFVRSSPIEVEGPPRPISIRLSTGITHTYPGFPELLHLPPPVCPLREGLVTLELDERTSAPELL